MSCSRDTIFHIWPPCVSLSLAKGWQGSLVALLRLVIFSKRGAANKRGQRKGCCQVYLTKPSLKMAKPYGPRPFGKSLPFFIHP